jgi:hypothetical protein
MELQHIDNVVRLLGSRSNVTTMSVQSAEAHDNSAHLAVPLQRSRDMTPASVSYGKGADHGACIAPTLLSCSEYISSYARELGALFAVI